MRKGLFRLLCCSVLMCGLTVVPAFAEQNEAVTEAAGQDAAEPTITVNDDFVVLHLDDENVMLDYTVENVPEDAQVRVNLSDGSVLHVVDGAEIIPYSNGLCDVTVEVYIPQSMTFGDDGPQMTPEETLAVSEPIYVTVIPHERENAGIKLGIQLFNFSSMTFTPQEGIDLMRYLASLGYDGVEWVDSFINTEEKTVFGTPYAEFKAIMDELGLESAGRHGGGGLIGSSESEVGEIDEAKVLADVEFCETFGVKYDWVASTSFMAMGTPVDLSGYTSEELEAIIDIANQQYDLYAPYYDEAGVTMMYHNHAEMFQLDDGSFALTHTKFAMQVDYYWLVKAFGTIYGEENSMAEGLNYVESNADRVVSLHIKDGTTDINNSFDSTSWGQGEFDIQSVIDIGRSHDNIEWAIVENDNTSAVAGGAMQDARVSALYAAGLDFTRIEN